MGGDSIEPEIILQPQETAGERAYNPRDALTNLKGKMEQTNWQRIGRAVGALGVVGLFALMALPNADQGSARAQEQPGANPVPNPAHQRGEMLSQQVTLKSPEKYPIEEAPAVITFTDNLGRLRRWVNQNSWGIPPNNPNHMINTIMDYIDGAQSPTNYFQPQEALYNAGEDYGIYVGGMAVDVAIGRVYFASVITNALGSNINLPALEIGADLNNPKDYSSGARKVTKTGLPQGGIYGFPYSAISLGSDTEGKYLEVTIVHSVTPSEDGVYRIRLNASGDTVGSFIRLPDSTPTPTPSPTPTNTPIPPTPTPTRTATPVPTITPIPPTPIVVPSPTVTPTPTQGIGPGPNEMKPRAFLPSLPKNSN